MIPVKVKWFRSSARARLWNAWILVKCCLHREAPLKFRIKFTKTADWLEATIEATILISWNGGSAQLPDRDKLEVATKAYRKLQDEVEALCTRRQDIGGKIENIKNRFVALLDLCGIKDADIPFFDEPIAVRYNPQTLITSFGIMSKRSPHSTPRRHRRARCDPSTYADMIIEQLLLAQANSVTDSDTSPPSKAEEQVPTAESEIQNNNNNDKIIIPFSLHSPTPTPQTFEASPVLSPTPILSYLSGNLANIADGPHITKVVPNLGPRSIMYNGDRRTPSHNTTDSGVAVSDHSLVATSCTCRPTQQTRESNQLSLQNETSSSTPELPTSESSTSLDIQFASIFDFMDCQDSARKLPFEGDLPPEFTHHRSEFGFPHNSQFQPPSNYLPFPTRYSHSYARQLAIIEAEAPQFSRALSTEETRSPSSLLSCISITAPSYHPDQSEVTVADNRDTSQSDLIFFEPLVVCLPPEPTTRATKLVLDKHDLNINKNYKPHLVDKNACIVSDSDLYRPPIPPRRPMTDSKISQFPSYPRSTRLSRTPQPSVQSTSSGTKCYQQSTLADAAQGSHQRREESDSSFMSGVSYDFSPNNASWSYSHPSDAPPENATTSKSTGKAKLKEKWGKISDQFVTVRSREPLSSPEVTPDGRDGSASKRRKGNNKLALSSNSSNPVKTLRSARQRLMFYSPVRSKNAESSSPDTDVGYTHPVTPSSFSKEHLKHTKTSSSMRKLKQQKENIGQHTHSVTRSPRQPLAELHNLKLRDHNIHLVHNNLYSPEANTESTETSPDVVLPSREEELLERDAYYCDFTVDRQYKIDDFISRKAKAPSSNDENESQTVMEDTNSEILTRKVEGAESSPSSFVFRAPPSNYRAPRTAVRLQQSASSKVTNSKLRYQSDGSSSRDLRTTVSSRCLSSISSSQGYPCLSSSSSTSHSHPVTTSLSPSSRSSSKSRRSSSSRKSCTSHPIASSTLIMNSGSYLPDLETASVYAWSINEGLSPPDFDQSYTSTKRNNINRPPVSVGKDSSKYASSNLQNNNILEITEMVSRLDERSYSRHVNRLSGTTVGTSTGRLHPQDQISRSVNNTTSDRHVLAAAHSFFKNIGSNVNNGSQQYSEISRQSSNQATTTSMFLNCARSSITYTTNEGSDFPEFSHSKHISTSEPNLSCNYSEGSEEGPFSLVLSDTDSSLFENRPDIPGRSNTSSGSSCTAARCRPRIVKNSPDKLSETVTQTTLLPAEPGKLPEQDLLDSILTDSPKSVNSSGIYVPHNSYNSPVESACSHNSYSSTASSSSTSTGSNYIRTQRGFPSPPSTPRARAEEKASKKAKSKSGKKSDFSLFKRPFTPAPHVDNAVARRNRGVTADSGQSTPHQPVTVLSEASSRTSVFAVPPGVVTGPPKIKDKNSLVRKFKKFSSNFYKKTEKIQTLANL